ncbi:MAG: hypothetical protein ACRET5_19410, partial [Steroidobacteraceae bacterium]
RSRAYLRSVFPGSFAAGEKLPITAVQPPVAGAWLPAWAYSSAPLLALEREHLLRPARQVVGHTAGRVEEMAVAANWKILIEQWLESDSPRRYFLPPNQLLDLSAGSSQLLQVVPEGPERSRLLRFDLRPERGASRRAGSARRGASPLARQIALAEAAQRRLEASPAEGEDGAAVPAALAEFRRSVAALLPLLMQARDTQP